MDGQTENIYSIFRDKLLLLGEHVFRDKLLLLGEHVFIGGPGGTGKLALFKKMHTACRKNGQLISICRATSLARPLLLNML
jgi:hypothetical protein